MKDTLARTTTPTAMVLACTALFAVTAVGAGTNAVPFADSFEGYSLGTVFTNAGSVWQSDDGDSASITNLYWNTDPAYSNSYNAIAPYPLPDASHSAASQVMRVDGGVTNHVADPGGAFTYIDTLLQPTRWTEDNSPDVATDTHAAVYFNSNGFLTAYITTNLPSSLQGWQELPNTFRNTNEWVRLTIEMNYNGFGQDTSYFVHKFFRIFVNGVAVSNSLGFSATGAVPATPDGGTFFAMADSTDNGVSAISIRNTATLDDFVVTNANPIASSNFNIAASSGSGGSIDPSGAVAVPQGFNQTFNFLPGSGYIVDEYVVDGTTNAGPASSYTFTNVQATHSIEVNFALSGGGPTAVTNGVLVAWLTGWGLDGTDGAALSNHDNDAFLTWEEFWAGTDPTSDESYFRFLDVSDDNGDTVLCWLGGTNGATNDFQIWCSTNLLDASAWTNVANSGRSTTSTNYWTNTAAGRSAYNIRVPVVE